MGGMHGFGPIEPEHDEPVFHAAWEARFFGLAQSCTAPEWANEENWRYTAECMPPALYLSTSYYERWYYVVTLQLVDSGMVTMDELSAGHAETGLPRRDDAMRPEDVWPAIRGADAGIRELEQPPRFSAGNQVRTCNLNSQGHTRLPRYARGKVGVIKAHRGANALPESNAKGLGENPEHVYSVELLASELWGSQAASKDKVYLDLWESYLEPI